MGGFAGIVCKDFLSEEGASKIVHRMLKTLVHRGPEWQGTAFIPYGGFGHQRLSIHDPRGGHQPMHHPMKPYVLVFDGEIYNFQSLREKLMAKGLEFHTRSDTEVLLMMYDHYDVDMFTYLEGMYSFALWDGIKKELLLARDPLGQKPLYYEMDSHGIAFASELKAILKARETKPALNPVALQSYLALQYTPSPMTLFDDIYKLPPGYMLRWAIETGDLQVDPIWIPDAEISKALTRNKGISMEDALKAFDLQLRQAFERQVGTLDMPLNLMLNDGPGSRILAALTREYTKHPVHTYTATYTHGRGQCRVADSVQSWVGQAGYRHHLVEVGPETLEQLPHILWHMDEPVADPNLLALHTLARVASDHSKVTLTGHGTAQLFGSLPKYSAYQNLKPFYALPSILRKSFSIALGGAPLFFLGWDSSQLLQGVLNNSDPLAIWHTYTNFPEYERRKMLAQGLAFPDKQVRVFSTVGFDPFVQLQWDDLQHLLPHSVLLGLDKVFMAANQEVRLPFLDLQLLAWSIGLPYGFKWKGRQSKYLLREYIRRRYPSYSNGIPQNAQAISSPPLDDWLYARLDALEKSLLESALFEETHFFSRPYIHKLFQRYAAGTLRSANPIWTLIVLKTWYDAFFKCDTKEGLWELQTLGRVY